MTTAGAAVQIPGLEKLHKGSGVRMGALSRAADRPHRLANSDAEKAATALAFAQEHPWLFGPTPTEATDVFDDGCEMTRHCGAPPPPRGLGMGRLCFFISLLRLLLRAPSQTQP